MAKRDTSSDRAYQEARRRIEHARRKRLAILNLSDLGLTCVPPEIAHLTALTTLDLSHNHLPVLPPQIGELTTLTKLYLGGNQLWAFPIEIGRLTDLTILRVHNNQISTLPSEIGQLNKLTELRLGSNRLSTLPPEIGQLTKLERLDLRQNQLSTLPPEIGRLTALKRLDLTGNCLSTLPPEIGQLIELEKLDLKHNELSALPPEIGQLTALRWLNLLVNRISMLPPEMSGLAALTWLNLSGNRLSMLPPEIGRLTSLTRLDVRANRLVSLPPEIVRLTNLSVLDLTGNHLPALPPEVVRLTSLTSLDVTDNRLLTLPAGIGDLSALMWLDLSHNQLSILPPEISRLTRLTGLFLHDNDLLGIPPEILGPTRTDVATSKARPTSPRTILDYYLRIQGYNGRPLAECKLIVVGRGGVGKTSLIKRLSGQFLDPQEPETHGITIQRLEFSCAQGPVSSRVWDFGGQVVLHSMHEFFLTARSLYLLVLGERDDMLERDAAYWLQLIRSYAGNAPVVVAINKSGGRQRQFDGATLERSYGPILGWVATECSDKDPAKGGITLLRNTLTTALDSSHMDSMRRKFPAEWLQIKSVLETMSENYLDYSAYVSKCEMCGVRNSEDQASLAADLHDLGVALNYGRDPRLRDTSVLRPDGLANGIYAVLRANDVDAKLPAEFNRQMAPDGIVTADRMEQIHRKAQAWNMLNVDDYPAEKREFLLRLMDLFHLSYPLDDDGRVQLVPTLLPPQPPAELADEPPEQDSVQLRYELQVVPAPLLPWFIARTFSLIPDRLHWRRGTILAFGDARARVWTTPEEHCLFVTVAGPIGERDRLLTIVRAILRDLFSSYRGIKPVEQWRHKGMWIPRAALEEFGVLPKTTQRSARSLADKEVLS